MTKLDYSAVILCGGRSTRMGTDKARLPAGDEDLLDRIIRGLRPCRELFLSARTVDDYRDKALPTIPDRQPGDGPMAGITEALARCTSDYLFVTTCDSPFVDHRVPEILLQMMDFGCDAAIPVGRDGTLYHLNGLYARSLAPYVTERLAQGLRKVRLLLREEGVKVKYVPADRFPLQEQTFLNVNTKEEYLAFLRAAGLPGVLPAEISPTH